jgi:hypothetical protein
MKERFHVPCSMFHVCGEWFLVIVVMMAAGVDGRGQAMTDGQGFLADFETPIPFAVLNSEKDDYSPSFDRVRRRLFFTSERSGTAQQWMKVGDSSVQICSGTFNERGRQRAYVSFGRDEEVVGVAFIAGDRQSFPAIVTVPLDNGSLNLGHPIPSLAGDHFTSQPALSPDGTKLVVASDRPGGEGGLDLWICDRLTNNEWSDPVLISASVNSAGDEISPTFISADSLVYASNGYGGKGGFDLFVVVLHDGVWQEPEPLTFFNSEFDESDLTVLDDWTVVFASNRPGGAGGLDLWVSRRRSSAPRH